MVGHALAGHPARGVLILLLLLGGVFIAIGAVAGVAGAPGPGAGIGGLGAGLIALGILAYRRSGTARLVLDAAALSFHLGGKVKVSVPRRMLAGVQVEYQATGALAVGAVAGGVLGAVMAHDLAKGRTKGRPLALLVWEHGGAKPKRVPLAMFRQEDARAWLAGLDGHGVRVAHGA